MSGLVDLDPIYFADDSWTSRFNNWIQGHSQTDRFAGANAAAVEVISRRRDLGLRMAINIPAYGLLLFLRDQHYKNAYERFAEAGDQAAPSLTRRSVDDALFPAPLNQRRLLRRHSTRRNWRPLLWRLLHCLEGGSCNHPRPHAGNRSQLLRHGVRATCGRRAAAGNRATPSWRLGQDLSRW